MMEPDGFLRHLAGLISGNLSYLRARLALAGLEGKEAGIHYAIILGLAVGALVITVFGYFFLIFAIVSLIAWLSGGGIAWFWTTFGAGLVHVGGAVALLIIARKKLSQPMFAATMDEFRKDQECLKTTPVNLA
jgi:uncharacterized membrane protein YqjE